MELVKVKKSNFLKKKLFPRYSAVVFKISHIYYSTMKKMRVKRSRNEKYFFYKNNAEKNGTFHMQIMLKCGNKHARLNCDTCKLSIRAQKQRRLFSLSTIFNNSCGVLIAKFQQIYSFGSFVFFNTSLLWFKM